MLVGAFFVLVGVIHTIGVKQDLKDGGRFLFGARDSFFIQLIGLDNQNGPEAHALKPAPFQDDEGDEKAFTLTPGMKLGIDATLGNDVNLDVAPAQKAGIRLTFTNAKFVLRGMELLNPNPREIVAYDKIDYWFLAQDYVSAVRKKKYEGDFCIQLYNSAVITEEMKAKSGNCDIITFAASGTTRLKTGLAALDSAQPSNLEVEYVNLED